MKKFIAREQGKLRTAVLCLALLAACGMVTALPALSTPDSAGTHDQKHGQRTADPKARKAQAASGSADARLACSWTEPVKGRAVSMIFARDCLLACRPGSAVHVSARVAGKAANVRCEADAGLVRDGGAAGAGLDLVVPESEGAYAVMLELRQGRYVRRMRICIYVPHKATLSRGRFGRLTVCKTFLGTYRDPVASGVRKVREHPDAYQPPTLYLRITGETGPLLVSPHLRLADLVVPDRRTGKRHTDLVPVNYGLLTGIEAFLGACRARGIGRVRFLSIFRTPIHNHGVGSGTFSQHKYMNAFDFIVDSDHDGQMDDFNHDGKIDRSDGLWLVAFIEKLQADGMLPTGGIGLYTFMTSDYRVTMHFDFRGHRARWAYAHDRQGRRHPFTWKSVCFAAQDKAEKAKHPDRWQEPEYELPEM